MPARWYYLTREQRQAAAASIQARHRATVHARRGGDLAADRSIASAPPPVVAAPAVAPAVALPRDRGFEHDAIMTAPPGDATRIRR